MISTCPGWFRPAAREIISGMQRDEFEITFPKGFTRMVRLASLMPWRRYFSMIRSVLTQPEKIITAYVAAFTRSAPIISMISPRSSPMM